MTSKTTKSKVKSQSKPKEVKMSDTKEGYKGHQAGSRKGRIHQLFDEEGADVAWTAGLRAKLAENTLRSWFAYWNRSKPAAAKKPAVKKAPTKSKDTKPAVTTASNGVHLAATAA
jgi:hypothetical protein